MHNRGSNWFVEESEKSTQFVKFLITGTPLADQNHSLQNVYCEIS